MPHDKVRPDVHDQRLWLCFAFVRWYIQCVYYYYYLVSLGRPSLVNSVVNNIDTRMCYFWNWSIRHHVVFLLSELDELFQFFWIKPILVNMIYVVVSNKVWLLVPCFLSPTLLSSSHSWLVTIFELTFILMTCKHQASACMPHKI